MNDDPRDPLTPALAPPFQLFLESKYAAKKHPLYENECVFRVPDTQLPEYQAFRLQLKGFTIPVSWYQIDNTTNHLQLEYNGVNYHDIEISPGNYSVATFPPVFAAAVAAGAAGASITCTLNTITNKWTFTGGAPFTFKSVQEGTSMFAVLGFPVYPKDSTVTYSSSGNTLVSQVPVDFSGNNSIYVQTTLSNNNLESFFEGGGGNTSIVGRVPVPVQFTGILNIDPAGFQVCQLSDRHIGEFTVTLLDENRNVLQATLPWEINFDVTYVWDPSNTFFHSLKKRKLSTQNEVGFAEDDYIEDNMDVTQEIAPEPGIDDTTEQEDPLAEEERIRAAGLDSLEQSERLRERAYETYQTRLRDDTTRGRHVTSRDELANLPPQPIISLDNVDPFRSRGQLADSLLEPQANVGFGTLAAGPGPTNPG